MVSGNAEGLELPTTNRDKTEKQVSEQEEDGDDSDKQKEEPQHEFSWYLKPENTFVIISKRWVSMTFFTFLIYVYHLVMAIYGVDQFTDISQQRLCKEGQSIEDASAVYQTAIGCVAIFHMVEWLRQLVFMTSALVNTNMMTVYYAMSLNCVWGFVACIIAIAARFGADGAECAAEGKQDQRGLYLALQLLSLFLYIVTCFHHILILKMKGAEWCHEVYNEEDEDDD